MLGSGEATPHRSMLILAAVLRLYRNRETRSFRAASTMPHGLSEKSVFGIMAGLVPAIHDQPEPWIRGSSPRMTIRVLRRRSAVEVNKVRA